MHNWVNKRTSIMPSRSFEIFVGPVQDLGIKETCVTVCLPRKSVSIEVEFTFSRIGEVYSFDICLPYQIVIDNMITCSARLMYEVVVWGPEGEKLTSAGRAIVKVDPIFYPLLPFHAWSVEYKAVPRPYWNNTKPPYSDRILIEGLVSEVTNEATVSEDIVVLRFFEMTWEKMIQIAEYPFLHHGRWWPLWFHKNSLLWVRFEFPKAARLSKETLPLPDKVEVTEKYRRGVWKIPLEDTPRGIEFRCVVAYEEKEKFRTTVGIFASFLMTSPVIMPFLSWVFSCVLKGGRRRKLGVKNEKYQKDRRRGRRT